MIELTKKELKDIFESYKKGYVGFDEVFNSLLLFNSENKLKKENLKSLFENHKKLIKELKINLNNLNKKRDEYLGFKLDDFPDYVEDITDNYNNISYDDFVKELDKLKNEKQNK